MLFRESDDRKEWQLVERKNLNLPDPGRLYPIMCSETADVAFVTKNESKKIIVIIPPETLNFLEYEVPTHSHFDKKDYTMMTFLRDRD